MVEAVVRAIGGRLTSTWARHRLADEGSEAPATVVRKVGLAGEAPRVLAAGAGGERTAAVAQPGGGFWSRLTPLGHPRDCRHAS